MMGSNRFQEIAQWARLSQNGIPGEQVHYMDQNLKCVCVCVRKSIAILVKPNGMKSDGRKNSGKIQRQMQMRCLCSQITQTGSGHGAQMVAFLRSRGALARCGCHTAVVGLHPKSAYVRWGFLCSLCLPEQLIALFLKSQVPQAR